MTTWNKSGALTLILYDTHSPPYMAFVLLLFVGSSHLRGRDGNRFESTDRTTLFIVFEALLVTECAKHGIFALV